MPSLTPKHRLFISVGILGFAALVSQMLFMRGLIVQFYGNEISIGVLFAAWLLWTAAGSGLLPAVRPLRIRGGRRFRAVLFLLALAVPLTDLGIRYSRIFFGAMAGEVLVFKWLFLSSLAVFSQFCLLSGYAYAAACRMIPSGTDLRPRFAVRIYALESFGSALGGLSATLLLFPLASEVRIMVLLSALLVMAGLILPPDNRDFIHPDHGSVYAVTAVSLISVILFFAAAPALQRRMDRVFWKTGNLLVSRESAYGRIAFAEMDGQISVFENGQLVSTCSDTMSAEESTHIPLLQHPSPATILFIGGGLGGAVGQAFQHPSVKTAHLVESDPEIIRLARKILPPADRKFLDDNRVKLHMTDARKFVRQTGERYDAVLLDMPSPHTLSLNRFYTLEFFREIRAKLNPGGIFSLRLPSSENKIDARLSDLLSTVRATLAAVFPETAVFPGHSCFFISSVDRGYLTSDAGILAARIRERNLKTAYVREYYLKYNFSKERSDYLLSRLHPVAANRLNRDLRPLATWYDMAYWSQMVSSRRIAASGRLFGPVQIIVLVFTAAFLAAMLWRRKIQPGKNGVRLCVAIAGFSGISLELIFLTAYQTVHGVLYQDMAAIVAGYMAGLGLGAFASAKRRFLPSLYGRLTAFQLLAAAIPVVSMLAFPLSRHAGESLQVWLFFGLNGLAGFTAGTVFGLANRVLPADNTPARNTAGGLYALDLAGAVAGVMFYTSLAVPLLGVPAALAGISLINLAGFFILWLSGKHSNSRG
jgi:spermidine synthase